MVSKFSVSLGIKTGVLGGIGNNHRFTGFYDLSRYNLIHVETSSLDPFLGSRIVISRAREKKLLTLFIQQYNQGTFGAQEALDLAADKIQKALQIRIFRKCHADPTHHLLVSGHTLFQGDIPEDNERSGRLTFGFGIHHTPGDHVQNATIFCHPLGFVGNEPSFFEGPPEAFTGLYFNFRRSIG